MLTNLPAEPIPVAETHPDQSQPRRSFDLAQLETLKADMATHGLLQPILVRRDAERKHFVIIFGERRWRCAKDLGWKQIPARVVDQELTPAEIVTIQLMENLARENLNPVEEARGLQRLQELLICSREELAVKTHRSPASICRSFKLLELPAEVQSLVELGRLPVSIAAELHRCTSPALQRELAEKVAAGELTREQVSQQVVSPKSSRVTKSVTLNLGSGISLRAPLDASFKSMEKAAATFLREVREAKQNGGDLIEWITRRESHDSTSSEATVA